YNKYSHALTSNPLIYLVEAGLLGIFLLHIITGASVTIRNRLARQTQYSTVASGAKATSINTKTMAIQGVVIFGFVVFHLITFKFGPHYEANIDGVAMRDIFRLVYEVFQSPIHTVWYIVALLILCFHLSHGLYSSLQTLGLQHPKYTPKIKTISVIYGIAISVLFITQPLYMLFVYKG
ncbi:MAG: hypothetical protein A2Z20_06045, partial [Bdellovibrionales bacterium RBG_16_40_8]